MSVLLAGAQFEHSPNAVRIDPDPNIPASDDQPAEGGIGYTWSVELDAGQSAFVTGHVGAWSWQDEALFDPSLGEEPVGWTHTSNWLFLDLKNDAWVTVRHQREEGIPWPSPEDPNRTASTKTMNPSFTIFAGYDGDGPDNHTWNNDGNVEWAEDITYLDHVNNSVAGVVEKSWFLTAGSYTLALGSNAPSNDTDRQGYRTSISASSIMPFEHSSNAVRIDPDPNIPASDDQPAEGGIGYTWSVELDAGQSAFVTGHVGAWSWQDEALFDPSLGEEPVGWTHTSNWLFLDLKNDAWVTVRHQREEGIPWPSPEDPNRTASTKTMNPSFTIFAGYDGDGPDNHTWNNDGSVEWAEDITYLDHVNNSVAGVVEKSWFLTAGSHTLALGSNAPSNDTDRQGYRTSISASSIMPFEHSSNAVRIDPDPNIPTSDDQPAEGGIGYTWSVELDAGQSAFVTGHVGAWSWQDEALFDPSLGEEPVGWTHTSSWLFLDLKNDAWVTVRHQREEGIPWPSPEVPNRTASTKTMNPSFTIFAGYDGDGPDNHTWNNDGNVEWAEDITYLDHVNNSVAGVVEKSWFLTAGSYTLALGSNAPSNDTDRQGYRTWVSTGNSKPEPSLFLETNDSGIRLSWTLGHAGYALQYADSIDFLNPAGTLLLDDGLMAHELPTDSDSMFFKLIKNPE